MLGRIGSYFFATFYTTEGKGLKACTREGMVFEWQKFTNKGLFFHMIGTFKVQFIKFSAHLQQTFKNISLFLQLY